VKKVFFFSVIFIALVACNKSSSSIQNDGLLGKWQLTEYFISPGDAGAWHAADNLTMHTIEFRTDNSFVCSDNTYNGAIGFNIIDSNRIELILPTQIPSVQECYFQVTGNGQRLILSPMGCMEGCSNTYKAIESDNHTN
jgi:hypothetical protein